MKIILTGSTGFVGGEVLTQLLADPAITGVTCLTRRPSAVDSAKLATILHGDFTQFDDALIHSFDDCEACIWALGGKAADLGKPEVLKRVTYDFTLALARKLASQRQQRFVFCYLSGMGADPTETAWFPWERLTRHLKGRTERDLLALERQQPNFHVHCFRPGGILPRGSSAVLRALLAPITVGVEQMAASLIHVAKDASFNQAAPVISNREIKRIAG